jgi:rare lipoprotein A
MTNKANLRITAAVLAAASGIGVLLCSIPASAIPPIQEEELGHFCGVADYYGDEFHGRRTASGQIHDKTKLVAAHRSLPFGTKVKLVNRRNKSSCVVTINDRGPFTPNRVIDVSKEAARTLGLLSGKRMVDCYVLRPDKESKEHSKARHVAYAN